jgi:hypothetical protein
MNKTALIMLLSVALTVFAYYSPFPGDFDSKTAAQKMTWLSDKIANDSGNSASFYGPVDMAKLVAPTWLGGQDMKNVYTNLDDQVTNGRKKLIHTVGKVVGIKFQMNGHSTGYTGCFAPNASCIGFARMSTATPPEAGVNTPGISFKLLRDGKPSTSFMAMWRLEGQAEENFFQNPMSHHVDDLKSGFTLDPKRIALAVLAGKFKDADPVPNMVGIGHVSTMHANGKKVANPKSPFQIVFQPNPAITAMCAKKLGFDSNNTYKCLKDIASGTSLYRIYAINAPKEHPTTGDMTLIGNVVSSSKFANSDFFDRYVQFTHYLWNQEVALMGSSGRAWNAVTSKGEYHNTAGAPKYKTVLPKW